MLIDNFGIISQVAASRMARENKTKSRYFLSQNVKMAKNNTRPNYARS